MMTEAQRQHEHHKAVRQRIWGDPEPRQQIAKDTEEAIVDRGKRMLDAQLKVTAARIRHMKIAAARRELIAKERQARAHRLEQDRIRHARFRERKALEQRMAAMPIEQPVPIEGATPVQYLKKRCADINITFEELIGFSRVRWLCRVRHILTWEIYTLYGLSFPRLGRIFGGRDHTTAINSVRRVEDELARSE